MEHSHRATPARLVPAARRRLLLISDEAPVQDSLAALLVTAGYLVFHVPHAADPLYQIVGARPEVIVVELGPGTDHERWHQQIRRRGVRTLLLVVSGLRFRDDRLRAFQLGADDHLEKPFHRAELLARIQALVRRGAGAAPLAPRLRVGPVLIDLQCGMLVGPRSDARLSRIECALIDLLAQAHGRPVSREAMLQAIWAPLQLPASRSVDSHVWRLRRKLAETGHASDRIESVPGVGYRMAFDASWDCSPSTGRAQTSGRAGAAADAMPSLLPAADENLVTNS